MQGLRRCSNDVVQLDLGTTTTNSSSSLSIDVDESTEARIQRLITEHPVIIFTRSSCCMCHVMKKLLATIGVNPTVIELDDHEIAALPYSSDDDHTSPTSAAASALRNRAPRRLHRRHLRRRPRVTRRPPRQRPPRPQARPSRCSLGFALCSVQMFYFYYYPVDSSSR
ncbi:Thioredoxin-like superfamily [Sesbania bispinosa]|nr:Thioredoxin-like superfamily [Sesbania bispinosa]